jgi:hypothetical protein
MSDLKDAAAAIRRTAEEKVTALKATPEMVELLKLHQSLNTLEELLGDPKTTLAEIFALDAGADTTPKPQLTATVRFDEFYGLSDLAAAKAYLKKRTDARAFQEIVDQIRAGGAKVESEDKLRTGLSRSTLDIVKIGERYGWLENYPDEKARRMRRPRRAGSDTDDPAPSTPSTDV